MNIWYSIGSFNSMTISRSKQNSKTSSSRSRINTRSTIRNNIARTIQQQKAATRIKPVSRPKSRSRSRGKSTLPLLARSDLSKKIQWLIDLGGTVALLEAITGDLCGPRIKVNENGKAVPEKDRKKMLLFMKGDGDAGHWVFYDEKGVKMDPYELRHQKSGSHQFCQTFSLIYSVSFCNTIYKTEFFDRLKPGPTYLAHNMRVAVDFWRHMFTKYHNPDLSKWMVEEVRGINDALKDINEARSTRKPETNAIAENTADIDLDYILMKLADIDLYADQISKNA